MAYLAYLKTTNAILSQQIPDTVGEEIESKLADRLNTLSDCIDMYVARIEAETDKLWKYYVNEKKQQDAESCEWFRLQVADDGFAPRICANDEVLVHKQSEVESGDIAVVTIDGGETAILRRIKRDKSGMLLFVDNNVGKRFEPIVIGNDERDRVRIYGKVISNIGNAQEVKPQ